MVKFPPPTSGSGAAAVEPAYPSAPERPGFVFPPPRQSSGSVRDAGRYVGEILRETADKADWAANEVNNVGEVVEDYGPQITDLIENRVLPWAVPTISPLSQTINRRADASFQLSDLATPVLTGNTATADGHVHSVTLESSRMFRSGALKGQAFMAFLTPAITREYEQLNFMVGEGTASQAQLDVAVYVVDPETRVMSRQVHVTDAAAGLPLSEAVVTVPFSKWVAVQGSYVAVAFLWHGTGDTRYILGIGEAQRPLPTEIVFPAKISARHTNILASALPASIDGTTQVDFNYWYTPYVELSEKIGDITRSFMEPWPDVGGDIDRPWVPLTARGIGSGGGYTAAYGAGMRVSIYDTPLASDHVRVSSSVYRIYQNQPEVPRHSTLIVRSSNDGRSGVGLTMNHQQYQLIEWANVSVDLEFDSRYRTVIYTLPVAPAEGDQIVVEYHEGAVDVWINGTQYVTAQAVGGPTAAAGRFVGIQNNRTGTFTRYISPWFGPWSTRDLPQSDGGDDNEAGD